MIQTIDEAILFCEQVTKLKEYRIDEEKEIVYSRLKAPTNDIRPMSEIEKLKIDAEYHRQLAGWLRELKTYRETFQRIGEKLSEKGYTEDDLKKLYEEVDADE